MKTWYNISTDIKMRFRRSMSNSGFLYQHVVIGCTMGGLMIGLTSNIFVSPMLDWLLTYRLICLIQPSNNSLVHFMVDCLGIRLPDLCGYPVMGKWQPQFALVRDSGYLHGVNIGHLTAIKYKWLI